MVRTRTLWPAALALACLLGAGCSDDVLSTEPDNGSSSISAEGWDDYSCSLFTRSDLGTQHSDFEGLVEHLELDVAEEDLSALEADLVLHCRENPQEVLPDALEQVAEG